MNLLIEAVIVSIIFYVIYKIINMLFKSYSIEFKIILSGILGHIFFELTGLNHYYCINGVACKKLKNLV
jgi:hypothetical protein